MIDLEDFRANPIHYFQVCAERCDECLFTKHRIVGSRRMQEVIAEARALDAAFLCHKHSQRAARGEASWKAANVCCRAYFDTFGDAVLVIRLAHMLRNIVFVDANGDPVLQEQEG